MEIYHQLGHNHKWSLDSHFVNDIGDGFIFNAYSFMYGKIGNPISGYKAEDYLPISMIDHQFFGNKASQGGKLGTYPYHPIHDSSSQGTCVSGVDCIMASIKYQQELGLKRIIVPSFFYELGDVARTIDILNRVNKKLQKVRGDEEFYMTLCFSDNQIASSEYIEKILRAATDMSIAFDGYYIASGASLEYKKKISVNVSYYTNLLNVLTTLKAQGFKTILGYANWDALVFLSLVDVDGVTIGTYENLRNFSVTRFTEDTAGGPSKGWYYSEKLLNMIKAQQLGIVRARNCISLIANEKNIFSDVILQDEYDWNTHKPDVHKNYLLAVSRQLKELAGKPLSARPSAFLERVEEARELYERLERDHKVFLTDESADYHLGIWQSVIKMNAA